MRWQNLTVVGLIVSGFCSSLVGAERPNVLLIVADDLGWADLNCYGSSFHETPHLDRLASSGTRFEQAYAASPVCSPTRASILTGKHPARLHMTIWRESAKNRGNRRLLQPVCLDSLPLEHETLAEVLRAKGYFTAHIGKWHLGRAEAYPQAHGFNINVGGTLWGAPQSFWYPFNGDAYFRDWRYVPDLEPSAPGDYLTDRLTDEAIELMEYSAEADRPFFINLWYHTVHTPIEGKPELVKYFDAKAKAGPQKNPHYAAMVHSLDENVGRVLAGLKALGLEKNTLVVFTSDNGGFVNECKLHPDMQVTSNAPLRSGKGSCYEGGVRVPLIFAGGGTLPNEEVQAPVWSCDLMPTILDMVGLGKEIPSGLDGQSLRRALKDQSQLAERNLYFHYPHYYPTTTPVSAVRSRDWKLLEYYEDGKRELYDLSTDIGESTNLAVSFPEVTTRLAKELQQWREQVDAQEPEVNPSKN